MIMIKREKYDTCQKIRSQILLRDLFRDIRYYEKIKRTQKLKKKIVEISRTRLRKKICHSDERQKETNLPNEFVQKRMLEQAVIVKSLKKHF